MARHGSTFDIDTLLPAGSRAREGLADVFARVQLGDLLGAIDLASQRLDEGTLAPWQAVVLRKHVVDWYAELGLDIEAYRQARIAAHDARAYLGATHPITLLTSSSELFWMCMTGYDEVARKKFPALIKACEKQFGGEHELTLSARINSAMPLKRGGDFAAAARIYRRLLADLKSVRPHIDPMVLTVRDNLAEVLALDDKYEESTAIYEAILSDLLGMFDPGDHRILRVRGEIAANMYCSGETEEAVQLWGVLAEDCRRHLGESHPETVRQRTLQITLAVASGDREGVIHWCRLLLAHLPEGFDPEDARAFAVMLEDYESGDGPW